jgi:hypothetical protein
MLTSPSLTILDFLIYGAAILIVVMLIVRQFWLWYWKINETVSLLKSIDAKLTIIAGEIPEPTLSDGLIKGIRIDASRQVQPPAREV